MGNRLLERSICTLVLNVPDDTADDVTDDTAVDAPDDTAIFLLDVLVPTAT